MYLLCTLLYGELTGLTEGTPNMQKRAEMW